MSLLFQSRASDSSYVQQVGALKAACDSVFSVVPDGSWGLIVRRRPDGTDVYLTGSTTRPIQVAVQAGEEILSVAFKCSAYSPSFPPSRLLDKALFVPMADRKSIWWNRHERVELPNLDSAEDFVTALVSREQIVKSKAVDAVLAGHTPAMSTRTLQRHFLKTTGMTQNYWRQIQRAQNAVAAIHSGKSLAQIAFESGYVDQSHMTRWLKQIVGRTPSELARARGA